MRRSPPSEPKPSSTNEYILEPYFMGLFFWGGARKIRPATTPSVLPSSGRAARLQFLPPAEALLRKRLGLFLITARIETMVPPGRLFTSTRGAPATGSPSHTDNKDKCTSVVLRQILYYNLKNQPPTPQRSSGAAAARPRCREHSI
jgi:hypothetical protein